MIEIHKVSPVHKQGTVSEYAYAYVRLQDRDFMWSHLSNNRFGLYFPPVGDGVPVRVIVDHQMKMRIDEMPPMSAKAICNLVLVEVANHIGTTMPKTSACTCKLHGRPCGVGEFLVSAQVVSSTWS